MFSEGSSHFIFIGVYLNISGINLIHVKCEFAMHIWKYSNVCNWIISKGMDLNPLTLQFYYYIIVRILFKTVTNMASDEMEEFLFLVAFANKVSQISISLLFIKLIAY